MALETERKRRCMVVKHWLLSSKERGMLSSNLRVIQGWRSTWSAE